MADSDTSESATATEPGLTAPLPLAAPLAPPRFFTVLARRPYALLALLGLLLWLPGILSLPPLDRDESRFAQSSRQMVESGNWVDIRFGRVPRYKKPVGIYWLQTASTLLASPFQGAESADAHIWTYRLPSLLGAIAASWLTVWCAMTIADAATALIAGLLMLGSVLLTAEAMIATTDAVLLACVLGVQGVLLRVYRAARDADAPKVSTRLVIMGWAACAAGILVKFPVVPGVAVATILGLVAWERKADWLWNLKPLPGLLLCLVLVSPWLVAITIQSQGAFFEQSLGNDFAAKIAGGQESHGMWPGYYLLLSAICFFPAILLVIPGVAFGIARRGDPAIRFLLAWAGVWWLAVEAVPTKLPHYVLPAYPALAILAALSVTAVPPAVKWLPLWLKITRWVGGVLFAIGAGLLTAAPILLPRLFGSGGHWWLMVLAGMGATLALAALILSILCRQVLAVLLSLLAMLVFVPTLTAVAAPGLDQLWISERLKPLVAAATRPGDPPPSLAGYQEPSLVFVLGADVNLTDGAGAAQAGAKSGGLALIEDSEHGTFLARLAELQADATSVGELSGFNYSRGKRVHISLYRVGRVAGGP